MEEDNCPIVVIRLDAEGDRPSVWSHNMPVKVIFIRRRPEADDWDTIKHDDFIKVSEWDVRYTDASDVDEAQFWAGAKKGEE